MTAAPHLNGWRYQVAEHLLSIISDGKYKVGDKLPPERVLMKQLDVGRSSLREAMGALILTGILSARPGRGTFVSAQPDVLSARSLTWRVQMGRERIEELVETRIVLEQAIAGLAAARAKESDMIEIRRAFSLLESALKKKKRAARVQADMSFHFALARASHNTALMRFLSELHNLMEIWMKQASRAGAFYRIDALLEHHREIVKAVEEHDVERAQKAMRKHLEESARNLSAIVLQKQLVSLLSVS
jgi:GntR family transcriptional repressor for pyruvate dehydrogenase complex